MDYKNKIKQLNKDLEEMNIDSSLLVLNINIDVFLNECLKFAHYVQDEQIESVSDKKYVEKIKSIAKKYKSNVNKVDLEDIKKIIQKVFYIYGNSLGIPFCLRKNIDEEYKKQVYEEVLKKIKCRDIVIQDDTLRIKSYGIQFIKYIYKTKESFNRFCDMISDCKNTLEIKKDIYSDLQLLKLNSLFSFDKNVVENDWFKLSNCFSEFYHNLIISLELYLKSVFVEVELYKRVKTSTEILEMLSKYGHNYTIILDKLLENKVIITDDSSDIMNDNYINKQIEKLKNNFYDLLLEFDENIVLEQVRYAESSSYSIKDERDKKINIKDSSSLYTSNIFDIINLFEFLYECFEKILYYRGGVHINIGNSLVLSDFCTIYLEDPKTGKITVVSTS